MESQLAAELYSIGADRRDLLEQYDRVAVSPAREPSILVACMPKSGSTFLSKALTAASGFCRREFVYDINGHNGWDLYLPKLVAAASREPTLRFVAQHHILATPPNLELIKLFRFSTVVLVRNLFDVIVSLRDHCLFAREDPHQLASAPLHMPRGFASYDRSRQYEWIIDFMIPWYFQFYVSWMRVFADRTVDCQLISYERIIADPAGEIHAIIARVGLEQSRGHIQAAVSTALSDRHAIRFNQGQVGRGAASLSPQQRDRVLALTRHYPDIDFTPIGLD